MMNWKASIGIGLTTAFLLVSLTFVPAIAASEIVPAAASSGKNTNQTVKSDTEKNQQPDKKNPPNTKQPDEYVPEK
ncbi:hypothetical protein [Anaerospora hongkongensis]|uniref:hypothetical protein n=1 Tax=Anaerospora hongkongensis TaxID=244830 RepID=UPI00289A1501|nr:hypothetical protein [Anaerospora hongkongensis]